MEKLEIRGALVLVHQRKGSHIIYCDGVDHFIKRMKGGDTKLKKYCNCQDWGYCSNRMRKKEERAGRM